MKKFLIVLILISSIVSFAQNSSLIGKIISDKNEPLEGVNILITGTQFGAASLSDGSFEIKNLPFGDYTLEVSMISYAKKKRTVSFNSDYSR